MCIPSGVALDREQLYVPSQSGVQWATKESMSILVKCTMIIVLGAGKMNSSTHLFHSVRRFSPNGIYGRLSGRRVSTPVVSQNKLRITYSRDEVYGRPPKADIN